MSFFTPSRSVRRCRREKSVSGFGRGREWSCTKGDVWLRLSRGKCRSKHGNRAARPNSPMASSFTSSALPKLPSSIPSQRPSASLHAVAAPSLSSRTKSHRPRESGARRFYAWPMDIAQRIAQFENMVQADPTNDMAHFSLGGAYAQAGRHAEAAKSYMRCTELNPDMSKAYQLAAAQYLEAGDHAKAGE